MKYNFVYLFLLCILFVCLSVCYSPGAEGVSCAIRCTRISTFDSCSTSLGDKKIRVDSLDDRQKE